MDHLELPRVLAHRYAIEQRLGQGGMGTTLAATDMLWDRRVALKLLRHLAVEQLDAFRAEFRILSGLVHPHLARVYDYGSAELGPDERRPFYTSALIHGTDLLTFARNKLWTEITEPLGEALSALAFLHRLGIRHGDIKPDNILVDEEGRATLIDLSCGQPLGQRNLNVVSGTRNFIAPELLRGAPADERADLFSVGVTLRKIQEVIEGPLPPSVTHLMEQLVQEFPRDRPSGVDEVLERLSARRATQTLSFAVPPPLLGREHELESFESLRSALVEGKPGPRVLLIEGPPGIGKSRILEEMKWRSELNCPVVEGNSQREDGFTSMLTRAVADVTLPRGISSVIRAHEALQARGPLMFVLDNVDRLTEAELDAWKAFVRLLQPTDPCALICTTSANMIFEGNSISKLVLQPLADDDVRKWIEGKLPRRAVESVQRLTGGFPAMLQSLLAELSGGDLSLADLEMHASALNLPEQRATRLRALNESRREALGLIAALGKFCSEESLRTLGVSQNTLHVLCAEGWIAPKGSAFRLCRAGEAGAIDAALGEQAMRRLHLRVARYLEQAEGMELSHKMPALVDHLWRGGKEHQAIELANEHGPAVWRLRPTPWRRIATLMAGSRMTSALLLAARIFELSGRPEHALPVLVQAMRSRPERDVQRDVRSLAGACYVRMGKPRQALRVLKHALRDEDRPDCRARLEDLQSRAFFKQGAYNLAFQSAQRALKAALDPALKADLLDDLGVAASYLGDFETSQESFEKAAALHEAQGDRRGQYRSLSYRGLNYYRRGQAHFSANIYRKALALAETHGLNDQIANGALNLGVALHQTGRWGEALTTYEQGLRVSMALAALGTEASFRFNLAKLYCDIGQVERAENALTEATAVAAKAGLAMFSHAAHALRSEIHLAQGDLSAARNEAEKALQGYLQNSARREALEVTLQLLDIALLQEDLDDASQLAAKTDAEVQELGAEDIRTAAKLTRARLALLARQPSEALSILDADGTPVSSGLEPLLAQEDRLRAELHEALGSSFLARRHQVAARERWERIASSLPALLRDSFWKHPLRSALLSLDEDLPSSHRVDFRDRFRRVLELNKRLIGSFSMQNVLEHALDEAIEISGAERGFVLVAEQSPDGTTTRLDVAQARNLDKETLNMPEHRFSRTIAERVLETGELLVTPDAQRDTRFEEMSSIHAMHLRAVVCIPIVDHGRSVGAIYLDNRMRQTSFRDADVELLSALADQVGIAIRNARLHNALVQRTKELERERKQVEKLMAGQAEEIDRLGEELRQSREALSRRYDYSQIVGQSVAMQRVLVTLDRIIDAPMNVLITGESGTGKELIARAIHANGPVKTGPFRAINCSALPEHLLEAELFGYVRGAFVGALRDHEGLFVSANGGTLFLDEVGELPFGVQSKLLRAIQERRVRPLGGSTEISFDVRLVCATSRDLRHEIAEGRFREDLFYRIAVVELAIPPLRDRREDIALIARHLLTRIADRMDRPAPRLQPDAVRALTSYSWPGNVRQLENVLTNAILYAGDGPIRANDIRLEPTEAAPRAKARDREAYQREEAQRILTTLQAYRWNVAEVSRTLGIPRATLYRKLKQYQIERTA